RPEPAGQELLRLGGALIEGDAAEAADVAEAKLLPVVEVGDEVRVVRPRPVGRADGELSGHAEGNDEQAVVQLHENPLAAAADGPDDPAREALGTPGRPGQSQRLGAGAGRAQPPTFQVRSQIPDDGFDFGQFGHGDSSATGRPDYTAQSPGG